MGRPINSKFFGEGGIYVTYNLGSGDVSGYIVRQISDNRFVVSDGSETAVVRMAATDDEAANLPTGVARINAFGTGEVSNATVSIRFGYEASNVASGGSGYAVGDRISITSAGAIEAIELRISSVSGGAVTGLQTWSTGKLLVPPTGTPNGSFLTIPSGGISNTVGTGTGLSVNINFRVIEVLVLNGGSGHPENVGYPVTGTNSPVTPTAQVNSVDGAGAVEGFWMIEDGAPITSWSNPALGVPVVSKHVTKINAKRAFMSDGTVVPWAMDGDAVPSGGVGIYRD